MPKSNHRAKHKTKLATYKSNKKKEQELFRKKMLDNYIKIQQDALAAQEAHTSTQEVSGPDIDVDALNEIVEWEPQIENTVDVEPIEGGYVGTVETVSSENSEVYVDRIEIKEEIESVNDEQK